MDFNKYYLDQLNNPMNGFNGYQFQRGYGLGSMFKKLFRWVIPIIKDNAMPILNNTLNKMSSNINEGINNFTEDLKNPNFSIKASANKRFNETVNNLKNNFQTGKGIKRKTKSFKKIKTKRAYNKNIFD